MSSQDFMTARRKFLLSSALGAGGLLFSSMLLASCTDHDIPDPQNPDIPPLFSPDIDWNDDAKTMVTSAIEMIPVAGDLLGGLVDIFWPSTKEDVWGEIKAQVEALIDQKMAAAVYTQVSEDLQGLNLSIIQYVNEIKEGTPAEILDKWIDLTGSFEENLPHFQSAGNQLPLLPLFGQYANMHLALLRDGVAFGQGWGRTVADHQQDITDLQAAIKNYSSYAVETFLINRAFLTGTTIINANACEPFKTLNTFDRQMCLTVLDFTDTWAYFDVTLYPNGTSVLLTREIYSDPFGSCNLSTNSNYIDFGSVVRPTQLPASLTVLATDRVDAVQLSYPANSGPNGVTQTPRMGVQPDGRVAGGSPSQAYTFTTSPNNPIINVRSLTAQYQNNNGILGPFACGMQFQFNDGTTTNIVGSVKNSFNGNSADTGMFGYAFEALSSVYIHGANTVLGGADCVVFGFMYWQSPAATLRAISAMYVKSPKERSVADFAKEFPKVTIPAGLITEELKMVRKIYWDYIKERAG